MAARKPSSERADQMSLDTADPAEQLVALQALAESMEATAEHAKAAAAAMRPLSQGIAALISLNLRMVELMQRQDSYLNAGATLPDRQGARELALRALALLTEPTNDTENTG